MKKIFAIVITLAFLLCCGCGTDSSETKENNSNNSVESNYGQVIDKTSKQSFDIYQITAERSKFDEAINNNSIDINYNGEFYRENLSTSESVAVQRKYIKIWKNEMDISINYFVQNLSEEDKETFLKSQEQWEISTTASLQNDRNILVESSEYGIYLGDYFEVLYLSQTREMYRERTIHIKYLHYLLETFQSDNINEFKSLLFNQPS